ncbi:MAG: hypothetical protein FWJ93_11740 [Micromonosporaceae bacterium]
MYEYDGRTGYEPISDVERKEFHERGFLLLRGVLSEDHRAALEQAVGLRCDNFDRRSSSTRARSYERSWSYSGTPRSG